MTLEGRLYSIITADAGFAALNAPLYALEAKQGQAPPYVVYRMLDDAGSSALFTLDKRYFNTVVRRYEFCAIATKMVQAEAIINALLAALCGSATPDASGQIQAVLPDAEAIRKATDVQQFERTIHFLVIGQRNG